MTGHELIELLKVSPTIALDIRYATSNNILGEALYSSDRCFLQEATAVRLHRIQMSLRKRNLGLKVFDGYRPHSVQKKFWALLPDPRFFADPAVGSNHNRGAAVDVTLIDAKGNELLMPSGFDEMTERAPHSYQGGPLEALRNRDYLKELMIQEGFLPCLTEWWHYDDPDWARFPILDIPIERL